MKNKTIPFKFRCFLMKWVPMYWKEIFSYNCSAYDDNENWTSSKSSIRCHRTAYYEPKWIELPSFERRHLFSIDYRSLTDTNALSLSCMDFRILLGLSYRVLQTKFIRENFIPIICIRSVSIHFLVHSDVVTNRFDCEVGIQ